MTIQVGVGISQHRNPAQAAKEATRAALAQAGTDHCDFVYVFSTTGYDQGAVVRAVREVTGKAPLAGASGPGIITQGQAPEGKFGVCVTVLRSDELRFVQASAAELSSDAHAAGKKIGEALKTGIADDTLGLFLFPDGLTVNFDRLANGIEESLHLPRFLPMFGGAAGDNWEMKQTYQYEGDQARSNSVSAVLMSGSMKIATAVSHGCEPIGEEMVVTKSTGNVMEEIDGKPALEALAEFMPVDSIADGETGVNMIVGFKAPSLDVAYDEYIIRYVTRKDSVARTVTLPTEVKQGSVFRVMRRDHRKIANGIDRTVEQLKAQLGGAKPKLVMHFDCAGRGTMLFREEEKLEVLKKVQDALGTDLPWMGFYTFGEIGPVGHQNMYHTYTAVFAVLY
jgi:hypothetical protein